jgi:hypothetical protein
MPLDKEIKGFIEKYKVHLWGGDESLELRTEQGRLESLDDGIYCLCYKPHEEEIVTHDKDTIEVKDGWIMKNESLYQSLRYVIDKLLNDKDDKDDKEDYVDPDGGDILETLSFRGENIEGNLYITFEFEYTGVTMSEIEEAVKDAEESAKWFS